MAVYPHAVYRPLNQFSNGHMHSYRGVVLHVNDSDGPSLYNWIGSTSTPPTPAGARQEATTTGCLSRRRASRTRR